MGLPVAHSLMGKGAISDENPYLLGMTGFWGTKLTNDACLNADYILAIGTRFKEADCSSWYPGYTFNIPGSKVIHIDIEPSEIGRNYPTDIGVIADAKSALTVLLRVAKEIYPGGFDRPKLREKIAKFKNAFIEKNTNMATSNSFPMMPERILADTRSALPDDAIITTDVGWNKNGVGQQFNILTPGSILTPGGFATMGFGPPAAIGAKLASPNKVVLSLVGDGGFGQNPAMLATAVELNLGIIWLVMNNNAFGTIAGLQKAHYGLTYGTTFPGTSEKPENGPDYSKIAEAYGAVGIKINSASELLPALRDAIKSNKPTVIDVAMINNPTPTTGHWNILDIYSPDKNVSHVST
jgi:acetolactate synthase-1/2/3 large subunit